MIEKQFQQFHGSGITGRDKESGAIRFSPGVDVGSVREEDADFLQIRNSPHESRGPKWTGLIGIRSTLNLILKQSLYIFFPVEIQKNRMAFIQGAQ